MDSPAGMCLEVGSLSDISCVRYMSYNLESRLLKLGYIGDCIRDYYRVFERDNVHPPGSRSSCTSF